MKVDSLIMAMTETAAGGIMTDVEKLRAALQVVLDQVDYTASACAVNEMVGAVLPKEVIALAHKVLEETKPEMGGAK